MKPVVRFAGIVACVVAGSAYGQGKVSFRSEVWPILSKSCVRCHKAPYKDARGRTRKPKAGLRLDGKHWILKGGEDGRVVVAGEPEKSPLYTLTVLPEDDEDRMPAKGDPLTKSQAETIRRWIEGGADFGTWVGEKGPESVKTPKAAPVTRGHAAAKPGKPVTSRTEVWKALGAGVEPLSAAVIDKAIGKIGQAKPLFAGSPLLRVGFLSSEEAVGSEEIDALAPLAGHIAELNLGRCDKVDDEALAEIGHMSRLTRLDLHQTGVTDKGLFRIAGLSELRYLNLHGCKVSDQGIQVLGRLAKLEALYLWKTDVTSEGVGLLAKRLPNARIHLGLVLPKPPAGGQDGNRRRRR